MELQTWKRKEYETWDEAFKALSPIVKQQSVRVASYTQVLYIQVCAMSFWRTIPGATERMNGKYAELAYKCGMYHQIGKALVPLEYQILQKDFTEEEIAVYRKYTTDGRMLAAVLQEKTARSKEKRRKNTEPPTSNITWLMIREACEQHMERYDGLGYPGGRIGDDISLIAQIVGLAKELDRLSAETKSENPFNEAMETLYAESGKAFSPELIEALRESRPKCRMVYNKFVHYTLTVPKTVPLVEKTKDRAMGLSFRAVINGKEERVVAYEALPYFGGVQNNPDEKESLSDIAGILERTKLTNDVSLYLLYECCDALLRIMNCKLELEALVMEMLPGFFDAKSKLQIFNKLFEDQPVDKSRLILTIPCNTVVSANKGRTEVIETYLRNGINLMVDNWDPLVLPIDKLTEIGFKYVRISPSLYKKQENAKLISSLAALGITVYAQNCDDRDALICLEECGVKYISGALSGHTVTEDELIRDSLLRERENE